MSPEIKRQVANLPHDLCKGLTMCRWLAYRGSPILLDTLLLKPEHSLIEQSKSSQSLSHLHSETKLQKMMAANEDGVGVGWYGERGWPGLYRDIRPAWNDENLHNLAEQTRSRLFFGHVRASSGTPVQRTNCHPFRYQHWLFQHNGSIAEFPRVKRAIDFEIAPALYPHIEGSTDSERLFYLALTLGLESDAPAALLRMAQRIESIGREAGIDAALVMTIAVTNGNRIFAVRYSSQAKSPTMYRSRSLHAIHEISGDEGDISDDAVVVLSEPLDKLDEYWDEIPEGTLVTMDDAQVVYQPFKPLS